MSGFAGLVRLDGRSASAAEAERLARAIAHRGPDDRGTWRDGSVALAHAMLFTTPESHHDAQPRVDSSGDLAIVADLRLDNRDELIDACGLAGASRARIGDSALVIAAYRRWGIACAQHLEGDFAFALWDRRDQSLFCARDAFGVKAFSYALVPGRCFAFGSEVRAPLAVSDVPQVLDESRIASYLLIRFEDTERTFHRDVRRLPGGCTLHLRDGRSTVTRYWTPNPTRHVRASDAEYAEGFAEHFTRAVRARMRVQEPATLGALLSGGLDSSSIAAVARNERTANGSAPLPVYSWVFSDTPAADEREYQHAMLETGGFAAHTLDSESAGYTAWSDIEPMLPDGPPYAPNIYLNTAIARTAHAGGVRVLLDGLGGDSTISRGEARFVELFLQGRAPTLFRELSATRRLGGNELSLARLFAAKVVAPLLPVPWVARLSRLRGRPVPDDASSILGPRLSRVHGMTRRPPFRPALTVRQQHVSHFKAPMLAEGLELFDRAMASHSVEGRYPFLDRQLAEYCLSLPADQKSANGYSRVVARRAMEGVLPPTVQWRAGKGRPGLHVIPSLLANRAPFEDLFVRDPSVLEDYVNIDVLRARYARFIRVEATPFTEIVQLWSVAVLGMWLRADSVSRNA